MKGTTIPHPFAVGERLFVLKTEARPKRKPCDACRGKKVILLRAPDEKTWRRRKCHACYGRGDMADGEQRIWKVIPAGRVVKVTIDATIEAQAEGEPKLTKDVRYALKPDGKRDDWPYRQVDAKDLFRGQLGARIEARRRNVAAGVV